MPVYPPPNPAGTDILGTSALREGTIGGRLELGPPESTGSGNVRGGETGREGLSCVADEEVWAELERRTMRGKGGGGYWGFRAPRACVVRAWFVLCVCVWSLPVKRRWVS
jgi:hypothetical protein